MGCIDKIKCFENELAGLEDCEELWWSQRARALWLKEGDKNTKFFHQKASQRKSRNGISSIQDEHGRIFNKEEEIGQVFNNFLLIFYSSNSLLLQVILQLSLKTELPPCWLTNWVENSQKRRSSLLSSK